MCVHGVVSVDAIRREMRRRKMRMDVIVGKGGN
jgi:hypothetical protein